MAFGVDAREIDESTMTSVLNECLQDFPTRRSAEEGTEDLPCELDAWKKIFLQFCRPASVLPDKRVAITEQSQEGVTYALRKSRLTLSLDLFRRTSWS